MGLHPVPVHQHRTGPPGVVIAPRPRERTLDDFLAGANVEERNDYAKTFIPVDATFSLDSSEATAPHASARTSYLHAPINDTRHTQVHRATSEWTQDDPMASPPHAFDPTTTYAASSATVAHSDGFALAQPFDATLVQQPEHPTGGYAHLHDGRSIDPQHLQPVPAAMDVLPPGPPYRKANACGESATFTPQPPLWNTGARTAPYGGTVATSISSAVGSQDDIAPPFHPPSCDPSGGRPHAPVFQGAAALGRFDDAALCGGGSHEAGPLHVVDPSRASSQNPSAQSAAIAGVGTKLYCEDMGHALAPLDSRVHDVARSDLAPSIGSLQVALPRAANRDMLHRMVPARKSTYSSLAGAVASPAVVGAAPHANPPVVNKNEGDHFDRTVAPGAGARYGRAVDDALRAHDYKGRNAEPRDHDARPFPSRNIYQATLQERSPVGVLAETTRLATPAPPPILVHEDQARFAPTYWTPHPSEQHAEYSRFERNTESYGPSYLEATSQQRYSDIVASDAAPPYTGSPPSSQSSITAPVQLFAHQHQVVSVPSAAAGLPSMPNLLPSSRVELDTSHAGVLDQATTYEQSFGDNVREAYLQQGWQMPNHDAGAFAPEQPTGLDYSGTGLYSQDAYTHSLAASPYAQNRDAGSNPNEPQFPADLPSERHREHAFAAEASSQYDRQGEHGQLPYNAEPPLWTTRALDLAQAAHYQRIALHPGSITHNVCAAPLGLGPSGASPFYERAYDNAGSAVSYSIPGHGPSADSSSPYARSTFVQRPNVPCLIDDHPYFL
ncbi:hypothetical protein TRAPUB_14038 [Trametes pubescens]|uniref:Uncharacterized protein n=1 Tax=Trametes pubescens TaxID=154538 RepID=A0A1M2VPH5_TRAPU|nr:hypothetical protein TRAPUB_14038 [Trametes pubescens]